MLIQPKDQARFLAAIGVERSVIATALGKTPQTITNWKSQARESGSPWLKMSSSQLKCVFSDLAEFHQPILKTLITQGGGHE